MTWWQTVPTFASAALIYFLPGLTILAAAGVRRLNLAALAAPVSTSVAACAAVVAPYLHLPYTPLVYFAISAVLAIGTFAVRWWWTHKRNGDGALAENGRLDATDLGRWTAILAVPLGVTLAAAFIARRFITGFGSPENFSQTFDNVYHLNAVYHIAQTQNGSSLTLGNLTAASSYFYPAGMHDMMALLQMLTGNPVPVVINVGTIMIGALVWPLGCMFLISRLVGYRPVASWRPQSCLPASARFPTSSLASASSTRTMRPSPSSRCCWDWLLRCWGCPGLPLRRSCRLSWPSAPRCPVWS
ncbi:conserved hypothetical protein [Arthrobacter sp. Hiyo6]|nr:conserved hypothetical protein [Arthrobacter sp. Hiyo6]